MKRPLTYLGLAAVLVALVVGLSATGFAGETAYRWSEPLRDLVRPVTNELRGRKTVEDRLNQYEEAVQSRLAPAFEDAGVSYPPDAMVLAALKNRDRLELYAREENGPWKYVKTYPVLAASGTLGPKLREGDRQVPEGVYQIVGLNPNSSYHLSMKMNYPNELDRRFAERDGRDDPGSDIFVHGRDASIGCLAMGDPAIEELFVATALAGTQDVRVAVAPVDFRRTDDLPETLADRPDWVDEKYERVRDLFDELPAPSDS